MPESPITVDRTEEIVRLEKVIHDAYDVWLPEHIKKDKRLIEREYDGSNRFHQMNTPVLTPEAPSVDKAFMFGRYGIGESFDEFVLKIQQSGLAEHVVKDVNAGKNTLFITAHTQGTLDTAIGHAALFCAIGDSNFAYRNGIIANLMMSRMALDMGPDQPPVEVFEALLTSGYVAKGVPNTSNAKQLISKKQISEANGVMFPILQEYLSEGTAIHLAPSNSRGVPTENGYILPRVRDGIAKIWLPYFDSAVVFILWIDDEAGKARTEIISPEDIDLKNPGNIHPLMEDVAAKLTELSGGAEVTYEPPSHPPRLRRSVGGTALRQTLS